MRKFGWLVVSLVAIAAFVTLMAVAQAGGLIPNDPSHYRGAPGPLLGAGVPVAVLAAGGYLLLRRFRGKGQ